MEHFCSFDPYLSACTIAVIFFKPNIVAEYPSIMFKGRFSLLPQKHVVCTHSRNFNLRIESRNLSIGLTLDAPENLIRRFLGDALKPSWAATRCSNWRA
mmetsp:Transcript_29126/g.41213  ORF Transcript_29126/g.41213 Transcript_29126/m.41213 type:complete len:99 (+) Transcript_29126:1314-1610(+)